MIHSPWQVGQHNSVDSEETMIRSPWQVGQHNSADSEGAIASMTVIHRFGVNVDTFSGAETSVGNMSHE